MADLLRGKQGQGPSTPIQDQPNRTGNRPNGVCPLRINRGGNSAGREHLVVQGVMTPWETKTPLEAPFPLGQRSLQDAIMMVWSLYFTMLSSLYLGQIK